jgi:hypothetical protein
MMNLYRIDHAGTDVEPFRSVETAVEAENEARAEILEGDAEVVKVEGYDTAYIGIAALPYACAQCGKARDKDSIVWYGHTFMTDETPTQYCSLDCATLLKSH